MFFDGSATGSAEFMILKLGRFGQSFLLGTALLMPKAAFADISPCPTATQAEVNSPSATQKTASYASKFFDTIGPALKLAGASTGATVASRLATGVSVVEIASKQNKSPAAKILNFGISTGAGSAADVAFDAVITGIARTPTRGLEGLAAKGAALGSAVIFKTAFSLLGDAVSDSASDALATIDLSGCNVVQDTQDDVLTLPAIPTMTRAYPTGWLGPPWPDPESGGEDGGGGSD